MGDHIAVGFRRLTDDDLPLLHRWLNDPAVVRWWEGDDVSWDGVVRDYGSVGEPREEEHWLALVDDRPVGWIQCYALEASPEESEPWWAAGVDRAAGGIDYLVGEPSARGQGLGTAMIAAFVDTVVFGRHPAWTQACAAPYAANEASWRALQAAGFRLLAVLDDAEGPCHLMVRDRADA